MFLTGLVVEPHRDRKIRCSARYQHRAPFSGAQQSGCCDTSGHLKKTWIKPSGGQNLQLRRSQCSSSWPSAARCDEPILFSLPAAGRWHHQHPLERLQVKQTDRSLQLQASHWKSPIRWEYLVSWGCCCSSSPGWSEQIHNSVTVPINHHQLQPTHCRMVKTEHSMIISSTHWHFDSHGVMGSKVLVFVLMCFYEWPQSWVTRWKGFTCEGLSFLLSERNCDPIRGLSSRRMNQEHEWLHEWIN